MGSNPHRNRFRDHRDYGLLSVTKGNSQRIARRTRNTEAIHEVLIDEIFVGTTIHMSERGYPLFSEVEIDANKELLRFRGDDLNVRTEVSPGLGFSLRCPRVPRVSSSRRRSVFGGARRGGMTGISAVHTEVVSSSVALLFFCEFLELWSWGIPGAKL